MADEINRRQLVLGFAAGLATATTAAPGSAAPLAAPLAAPRRRSQRSNINLSIGEIFRDHKFINCAKSGSRIVRDTQSGGGGTPEWYQNINADHYPTEGQVGVAFYANLNGETTYVIRWRGRGAVTGASLGYKKNAPKGIWTGGGADGKIVENGRFTCLGGSGLNGFYVKGPSISDLVICRADEEALLDEGQIFRSQYLDLIRDYAGILRFSVGPDCTNRNALTNWTDRPLASLMTYNGGRYYPNKKLGQLSGNGAYKAPAYTGMPVTYSHGEIVHFSVAQDSSSANCTLDVGGRGPKPIVNEYLRPLEVAGANAATRLLAAGNYSATYDANLAAWIYTPQFVTTGHPLEIMIAECAATRCPGWFSIPFNASDDYAKRWGQTICDTYKQDVIYVEYANEIWNNAYGFPMTGRAMRYGANVLGLPASNNAHLSGWYAFRFRQIAEILRNVFALNGQSSKLKMVLAGQGVNGETVTALQAAVENARFQNEALPSLSGTNAAIASADVVSYGLYYSSPSTRAHDAAWSGIVDKVKGPLKKAVDQFLSGDAKLISLSFSWMAQDFLATEAIVVNARFKNWNDLAAKYNKEVRLYECNHEIVAPSATWCATNLGDSSYGNTPSSAGKIQQFLNAFFDSSDYENVVSKYLQDFYSFSQSAGFSLFGVATPEPWLTFPKSAPGDPTGDVFKKPFANWRANATWNKSH
ncbi:hypothetical protein IVA95_36860 [Bradyrhizobium sp. 157]|uniref:hypothetical protein n=1 Tax=Bradyrhizobium sp. 157 TaxID=2782631 RepID=UPI001FF7481A|nr:hypothetical protein [Bradyrhizobium sp. 157]MCK1642985.1 hypothetical protein [Bradyrhizobium sp. 157]